MRARLRRALAGLAPAGLAGAFFGLGLAAFSIQAEGPQPAPAEALAGCLAAFLVGALLGVAVLVLIRLFRVARWAYPACGFLVGPAPLVILAALQPGEREDPAGTWFVGALLGVLVGVLEWARASRRDGPLEVR